MDITYINNRIQNEICYDTINKLTDTYLLEEYKQCKSVKEKINKLNEVLQHYNINNNIISSIIGDYISELIPAGTKGIIRGNKFNNIVKNSIIMLDLNNELFDVCFEKQCPLYNTDEIPDWYILEKNTNKILIGMNQLDLWNGGQQLNRGYKYIINHKNTDMVKLVCVICNKINFISDKNKAYKIFSQGYSMDTLCYINNLQTIIIGFFGL